MPRTHFGTDGVRGIVGETLTTDLVERLGRAATVWAGRGRVFVGRDTRGSGPELEAGARPRHRRPQAASPCSAACCRRPPSRCSPRISAWSSLPRTTRRSTTGSSSSTPTGHKLSDADEEAIEALLDATGPGGGSVETAESTPPRATSSTRASTSAPTSPAFGSRSTVPTAPTRRSLRASSSGSART